MRLARPTLIFFALFLLLLALTLSPGPVHAANGLTVTPTSGLLGTAFQFTGSGYQPNERVALWHNNPDGSVASDDSAYADATGAISFTIVPTSAWQYGHYSEVAHGQRSQIEYVADFDLNAPQIAPTSAGQSGCGNGYFSAVGFAPNELLATWTTRPDGVSLALPNEYADAQGNVNFAFIPQAGWPVGDYIVVALGYTSKAQQDNDFHWDGATLSGGGSCGLNGSGVGTAPPVDNSGASQFVFVPKNIPHPQGPGIYMSFDPNNLVYADCDARWHQLGPTIYTAGLGFQPNERVRVSYEILGIQGLTYFTTLYADGNGNVSMVIDMTGATKGHYHWWFNGSQASYCGHYDLT